MLAALGGPSTTRTSIESMKRRVGPALISITAERLSGLVCSRIGRARWSAELSGLKKTVVSSTTWSTGRVRSTCTLSATTPNWLSELLTPYTGLKAKYPTPPRDGPFWS